MGRACSSVSASSTAGATTRACWTRLWPPWTTRTAPQLGHGGTTADYARHHLRTPPTCEPERSAPHADTHCVDRDRRPGHGAVARVLPPARARSTAGGRPAAPCRYGAAGRPPDGLGHRRDNPLVRPRVG